MPAQKIGLLLYPGCMPAGLFAFADLLTAANRRAGEQHFELCWVGLDSEVVDCAQGMRLQPQSSLAQAACSAVLIPGLWADSEAMIAQALETNRGLIRGLSQVSARRPPGGWRAAYRRVSLRLIGSSSRPR
jgi:transcriptional regulator GlxA family with amidase domain